jgi:putative ABC transport system permease protein
LSYLHPEFLKLTSPKVSIMFVFNPKLALRSLSKHRLTTAINLFGFVIGLVAFFFLYSYTQQELSYDSFHKNKDNIYRIYRTGNNEKTDSYNIAYLSGPYADALTTDYPAG